MTNDDDNWIGGDGGPLIVLQAGALPHWRGAADFEQSLMNGGPLETDYDLICDCDNYHMHRHGRDMLVLDDCEWVGRIFRHDNGVIVVEQCYYASEDLTDIVQQTQMAQPEISFPITVEDHRLRLLVGADDGNDANDDSYGFSEVDIGPDLSDVMFTALIMRWSQQSLQINPPTPTSAAHLPATRPRSARSPTPPTPNMCR